MQNPCRRHAIITLGANATTCRRQATYILVSNIYISIPHPYSSELEHSARRVDTGQLASVDGVAVADPHVADILSTAFKKLSEQSIKDMYTKDKSARKAVFSTSDDEAGTDLREELAATKKQLEKANNKLAGLGRQHAGRKDDLQGAKTNKDDKTKPSEDKDIFCGKVKRKKKEHEASRTEDETENDAPDDEVEGGGRACRQKGWWKREDMEAKLNTVNMTAWVHKECDIIEEEALTQLQEAWDSSEQKDECIVCLDDSERAY